MYEKPRTRSFEERFLAKIQKTDGCWLWLGSTKSNGYGRILRNGVVEYAHRVAWELANGESVPEGLCVLHLCDESRCVRPDHLYAGTKQQNAVDTHSRGRWYYVAPGHGRRQGPPRKSGPKRTPISERFWPKVDKPDADACWLWLAGCWRKGYGQISEGGGHSRRLYAHRVAWELVKGPIPEGMDVLHHCDVRRCVNPAHLYLGTDVENARDRALRRRGREHRQSGEANANLKLTDVQVTEIRARYTGAWGEQTALAKEYGVGQAHISRLVHGKQR